MRISYFENSLANRSESWTSSKILFCPMTLDSINGEISNSRMVGFVMLYRRAGFNIYNGGIDNTGNAMADATHSFVVFFKSRAVQP